MLNPSSRYLPNILKILKETYFKFGLLNIIISGNRTPFNYTQCHSIQLITKLQKMQSKRLDLVLKRFSDKDTYFYYIKHETRNTYNINRYLVLIVQQERPYPKSYPRGQSQPDLTE